MDPKVKSLMQTLETGVTQYMTGEQYTTYLKAISKFHNYSFNNIMLILLQCPDATHVAGYTSWQKNFHRHVKKGEKGIRILAPAPFKAHRKAEDGTDEEILVPNFKVTYVWDISQTDGDDLPALESDVLTGDVDGFTALFSAVKAVSKYPIELSDISGGALGYCNYNEKRIVVQQGMSEAQTVKTAIHELAHSLIHSPEQAKVDGVRPDQRTREVQAESVAYVVCNHFKLDTRDYSFPYIASWSTDLSLKELRQSQEVICKTAHLIIESLIQQGGRI